MFSNHNCHDLTVFHLFRSLPRQMQDLADDYQRALADISSLRAIYDTEIEGLTEELSQCKAAHGEELGWWDLGEAGCALDELVARMVWIY